MPYTTTTKSRVIEWLDSGVIRLEYTNDLVKVFKKDKELTQRYNRRRDCKSQDLRVDLRHKNERISLHVSQLVWMDYTREPIPKGFEVHHIDGNPDNNSFNNLIVVHSLDHLKLHTTPSSIQDELPF